MFSILATTVFVQINARIYIDDAFFVENISFLYKTCLSLCPSVCLLQKSIKCMFEKNRKEKKSIK